MVLLFWQLWLGGLRSELSVCLSIHLSILSVSVSLSICLFIICLSMCLYVRQYVIFLSIYL